MATSVSDNTNDPESISSDPSKESYDEYKVKMNI